MKKLRAFFEKDENLSIKEFVSIQYRRTAGAEHVILRIITGTEISMMIYGFFAFNHANPYMPIYETLYALLAVVSIIVDMILSRAEKTESPKINNSLTWVGYFYFSFITTWALVLTTFDKINGGSYWVVATVFLTVSVFLTLNPLYTCGCIIVACIYLCLLNYWVKGKFETGVINIVIFAIVDCAIIFRNYFLQYNNLSMEMALKEKSQRDGLTSLNNRRALDERISEKDFSDVKSIAIVDIDNFKVINDETGHKAGDEALLLVSSSLRYFFKDRELFRYGGDEFLILSESNPDETSERLKKMNRRLAKTENESMLHLSGGITATKNGVAIAETIDKADKLLYEVKRTGKGSFIYK